MTVEGAITAVGDTVSNTMDAFGRLFPGIAMGSEDRAKSRSLKRAMRDMETVKGIGIEKGISQESINAMCSAIAKERIGCERLSSVVNFAAECQPDVSNIGSIDPSWAESFRSHAERAADEDIQRVWGAILAGEMDKPGSISKRTMSILSDMGKSEADSFNFLCSQCIGGWIGNGVFIEPVPLMIEMGGSRRMGQDELDSLNALGLTDIHLNGVTTMSNYPFDANGVLVTSIGGVDYIIEKKEGIPFLSLSKFTRYGIELSTCCEIGRAPGFREAAIAWLEGTGAKVMQIVKWDDDGNFYYEYDDQE